MKASPWIIACHFRPNRSATAPATSGPTPIQRNPMIAPNNSVVAGVAGSWNKLALLGVIFIFRSLALAWYFILPATPATTLLFCVILGFLWMGVAPLVPEPVAAL